MEGFTNVDILTLPEVDQHVDLNRLPWPWHDNTVEEIILKDVVEHLVPTIYQQLDECWRILRPGGTLYIKTPDAADLDLSFADGTHRWHFRKHTFANYTTIQGARKFGYTECPWSWMELSTDGHYIVAHGQPAEKGIVR
jgi:predicted SAM-dependent methyltransferase